MQTISVGDRVRVRPWDDMAAEFGYANYNRAGLIYANGEECKVIDTPLRFAEAYRYLCGAEATVVGIHDSKKRRSGKCEYLLDDWSIKLRGDVHLGVESLELVTKGTFNESLFYEALGIK